MARKISAYLCPEQRKSAGDLSFAQEFPERDSKTESHRFLHLLERQGRDSHLFIGVFERKINCLVRVDERPVKVEDHPGHFPRLFHPVSFPFSFELPQQIDLSGEHPAEFHVGLDFLAVKIGTRSHEEPASFGKSPE